MIKRRFYCLCLADVDFFVHKYGQPPKWYIEGARDHWMIKDEPSLLYNKRCDVELSTDREVFDARAERLKENALRSHKVLYASVYKAVTAAGAVKKVAYEAQGNLWAYRPTLAECDAYNSELSIRATRIICEVVEGAYGREPRLDCSQIPRREDCVSESHYETLLRHYVHALAKFGYISKDIHDELFWRTNGLYNLSLENAPSIEIKLVVPPCTAPPQPLLTRKTQGRFE